MVAGAVVTLCAVTAFGRRMASATGLGTTPPPVPAGVPTLVDLDASALVLTDQHGRRTSFGDFHGGPVLVTFAFGHCATVCPTIVHEIRAARTAVGRSDVPLLIISLDPWRDTPARLPSLASDWKLGPADLVLSGSVAEVEGALDALGVGRRRNTTTGDIEHAGTVMALDDRGHIGWRLDGGWGGVKELLAAMPPSSSRNRGTAP